MNELIHAKSKEKKNKKIKERTGKREKHQATEVKVKNDSTSARVATSITLKTGVNNQVRFLMPPAFFKSLQKKRLYDIGG